MFRSIDIDELTHHPLLGKMVYATMLTTYTSVEFFSGPIPELKFGLGSEAASIFFSENSRRRARRATSIIEKNETVGVFIGWLFTGEHKLVPMFLYTNYRSETDNESWFVAPQSFTVRNTYAASSHFYEPLSWEVKNTLVIAPNKLFGPVAQFTYYPQIWPIAEVVSPSPFVGKEKT